ncbi:MAG: FG-GAP repeat domain-containing protein [Terriglobales bacterium]
MSRAFFTAMVMSLLLGACGAQQAMFAPAPGSPFAVAGQPEDVALADLDGNQTLDIVTASPRGLNVLLGDGRGGFRKAAGSAFAAGPSPHLVAVGDLNGDGKMDLAATSHDSNDVYILLGDGAGNFRPAPGSPFPAFTNIKPHNHGLALVDVNGDGRLDITTGHQESGHVAVLLNDGRGGFAAAPGTPLAVGRTPYPHAFADLNHDGNPDLVVPDVRGSAITVMLGNGRGGFAPAPGSPIRTLPRPFYVLLADFNADRNLDIAVAHDDISSITILLGNGRGAFQLAPTSPSDAGRLGGRMVSGDWNRDGYTDLAIIGGGVVLLLGNGKGSFSLAAASGSVTGQTGGWALAVGDVNHDGKLDLVAPGARGGSIAVLLGR